MASRLMSAPTPPPPSSRKSRSRPPTSMTGGPAPMRCRTRRAKSSPTAPIAGAISAARSVPRAERRASSPPGAGQDRKGLWKPKAELRPAANAMARPRQSCRAGSPHRHRLQPQARPIHRRSRGERGVRVEATAARDARYSANTRHQTKSAHLKGLLPPRTGFPGPAALALNTLRKNPPGSSARAPRARGAGSRRPEGPRSTGW